jgi:hypothetical protein
MMRFGKAVSRSAILIVVATCQSSSMMAAIPAAIVETPASIREVAPQREQITKFQDSPSPDERKPKKVKKNKTRGGMHAFSRRTKTIILITIFVVAAAVTVANTR